MDLRMRRALGFAARIAAGEVICKNGTAAGMLPGRLVRGTRERLVMA
jgi:hypothetical protein